MNFFFQKLIEKASVVACIVAGIVYYSRNEFTQRLFPGYRFFPEFVSKYLCNVSGLYYSKVIGM